jgi:hypothetical protein
VGSETRATGPSVAAIGMMLLDGRLSRPFTLSGYPTTSKQTSDASSVSCFGVNCVVTGEVFAQNGYVTNTSIVLSALRGADATTLGRSSTSGHYLGAIETACSGGRSCVLVLEYYSNSYGSVTWDNDSLQGTHLVSGGALPGASLVTNVDGLSAAPGGSYEVLLDEGTVVSTPLILQT